MKNVMSVEYSSLRCLSCNEPFTPLTILATGPHGRSPSPLWLTIAVRRQEVSPPPQEDPSTVEDERGKVGLRCGPRPLGQCRAIEPYYAPWVAFDALRWPHDVKDVLLEQVHL